MNEAAKQIRRALGAVYHDGDVIELRAFRKFSITGRPCKKTVSGFFDSLDELAEGIDEVNHLDGGTTVFTTLNPIRRGWQKINNRIYDGAVPLKQEIRREGIDLTASQRLIKVTDWKTKNVWFKMRTTSAEDILERHWILLDIDAGQPTDTNSTDAEKQNAFDMALAIIEYLQSLGFPALPLFDSGNGYHILMRVRLPNDDASTDLVRRFLLALGERFDGKFGTSHLDLSVFDASRICKSYGSMTTKGEDTPERPRRRSGLMWTGSKDIATLEQVTAVAAEYIEDESPSFKSGDGDGDIDESVTNVLRYLDARNVEHGDAFEERGLVKIPVRCPNETKHTTEGNPSSTIVIVSQSGYGFDCRHDHCHDIDWHGFRQRIDVGREPYSWFGTVTVGKSGGEKNKGLVITLKPPKPQPQPKSDLAVALLKSMCTPRAYPDRVYAAAEEAGISRETLRGAYEKAGITVVDYGYVEGRDFNGTWLVSVPDTKVTP
jgi:hypothetical protein